jgi:hypothetical protein
MLRTWVSPPVDGYDEANVSVPATATRSSAMSPTNPLRVLARGSTRPGSPTLSFAGTVWGIGSLEGATLRLSSRAKARGPPLYMVKVWIYH